MTLTIKNNKPLKVHVTFTDDEGNAAKVDGDVHWSTSEASVATVTAMRPDTATAVVTPTGPAGSVDITAMADARIGPGLRRVSAVMSLDITAGEATSGHITPIPDGSHIPPPGPVDPDYGVEAPPPHVGGGPIMPPPVAGHPLPEPPPVVGGGPVEPPPTVGGGPIHPGGPVDPGYGVEENPPHVSTGPVPPQPSAGHPLPEPPPTAGHPLPPEHPEEPPAKPKKKGW